MATAETSRRRRTILPPSTAEVVDVESVRLSDNKCNRRRSISTVINLSDSEDEDVRILNYFPKNTPYRKRRNRFDKGECSNSKPFICEICAENRTLKDAFYISGCSHAYCSDCVAKYIGSKFRDNVINIGCPALGCSGVLKVEDCRSILPIEVFNRWAKALSDGSNKSHRPLKFFRLD